MNPATHAARVKIVRLAGLLFERRLLDAAGGNLSLRVDDVICISPRYAGSQQQWDIRPEQVVVLDMEGRKLDGEGDISREAKVHLKLHNTFGEHGTGVIHAHSQNILVFCAMNQPIPPVLEATLKFGEIKTVPFAPAHSQDLAEHVAEGIRGQEARIAKHAAAVIMPWHGLFLMGKDLDAAFDAVERIDNNARCIILGQIMKMAGTDSLSAERAALMDAMQVTHKA